MSDPRPNFTEELEALRPQLIQEAEALYEKIGLTPMALYEKCCDIEEKVRVISNISSIFNH